MVEMVFNWDNVHEHRVPLSPEVAVLVHKAMQLTGEDGRTRCVEVDEIDNAPGHVIEAMTEVQIRAYEEVWHNGMVLFNVEVRAAVMHEDCTSYGLSHDNLDLIVQEAALTRKLEGPDFGRTTYTKYVDKPGVLVTF